MSDGNIVLFGWTSHQWAVAGETLGIKPATNNDEALELMLAWRSKRTDEPDGRLPHTTLDKWFDYFKDVPYLHYEEGNQDRLNQLDQTVRKPIVNKTVENHYHRHSIF